MTRLNFRACIAAALIAGLSFLPVTSAQSAEATCQISQPIAGGMLHLIVTADGANVSSVNGAVELYTASAPPPLGLRDGTYTWDTPRGQLAGTGGVLSLQFAVNLPLSEMPRWGTAAGNLVPTRLIAALPPLINPFGGPLEFSGLVLISGNGVYNTAHDWSLRSGDNGMILTNAPERLSVIYSRELLQLISRDPNEPISIFLTPSTPGAMDSIASFHTGGLIEAPSRVATLLGMFAASNGNCESPESVPEAAPDLPPEP